MNAAVVGQNSNDIRKGARVLAGQSYLHSGEGFLTVLKVRKTAANVIVQFEGRDFENTIPRGVTLKVAR